GGDLSSAGGAAPCDAQERRCPPDLGADAAQPQGYLQRCVRLGTLAECARSNPDARPARGRGPRGARPGLRTARMLQSPPRRFSELSLARARASRRRGRARRRLAAGAAGLADQLARAGVVVLQWPHRPNPPASLSRAKRAPPIASSSANWRTPAAGTSTILLRSRPSIPTMKKSGCSRAESKSTPS